MTVETITAKVQGNIEPYRLLRLSAREEGLPVLLYAENGYPHFRSTKGLTDGQEVTITITGKQVWEVEAGENIKASEAVYAGKNGKLFSRKSGEENPADLIGYAIHNAEEGKLIKFVRSFQMNGNWLVKVNDAVNKEGE